MKTEPNYDAEMKLPDGMTCGDCVHIKRCIAFGFTSNVTNTSCDFYPRRFVANENAARKVTKVSP